VKEAVLTVPVVNPKLLRDIKRYGAAEISACFNCGNCSAVCPLSEGIESFPRRVIRLGQLGRTKELLASDEPWLCHYCGECTRTCPRQAEPGEYLASVRRWTIAQLEPTGLGKLLLGGSSAIVAVTLFIALILRVFLLRIKVEAGAAFDDWPFRALIAYGTIHAVGIGAGVLLVFSLAVSLLRFVALRRARFSANVKIDRARLWGATRNMLSDVGTMRRHRSELRPVGVGWLRDPWLIHWLIVGGFMGLLLATALDFVVLYMLKNQFHLSVFWPARLIGTVAGVALLVGVTLAIVRRVRRDGPSATTTQAADAWLLFFLVVLAVTGFWIEVAVTFALRSPVNDWVLLVHSVMAMELVLLVGATKLAHAVYRPLAILFSHLRREPDAEVTPRRGCAN
jgi:ferredoxin